MLIVFKTPTISFLPNTSNNEELNRNPFYINQAELEQKSFLIIFSSQAFKAIYLYISGVFSSNCHEFLET